MEMQRTYPDLAIRGRPLLPDKPHKAHSSTSNSKVVCTTDLPKRDCLKNPKAAAAATTLSRNDDSKTKETYDNIRSSRHCEDSNSGDSVSCSFNSSDRSRAEDGLSGPQAISLHLTLRAGSKEQKPGEPQPTEEPLARAQQNTEPRNESQLESEFSTQSSVDEEQELRELAERMGQLCVEETNMRQQERRRRHKQRQEEKSTKIKCREREKEEKPQEASAGKRSTTRVMVMVRAPRPPQCDPAGVSEQQPKPAAAVRC
ncbi:uncharacterized protein LOC115777518 isoform X2 [Archocentrus centrarchus]|nr:uncharacterized protein LOC115777518 isoform X2 [Archocentrus centrarchus]